jgi:hypothetical protein
MMNEDICESRTDCILRLEEIQRLKNELAEKQKYVLQVERYGGQLRAALRRIKVIGDESHENDAHCCAHEAEQALEQE